jgi:hypothetical protein
VAVRAHRQVENGWHGRRYDLTVNRARAILCSLLGAINEACSHQSH